VSDPLDSIKVPTDLLSLEPASPAPVAKSRKSKQQTAKQPLQQEVLPPIVDTAPVPVVHEPKPYLDETGRKFQLPKVDLAEVEMMSSVGMTTKQIADALGVPPGQFGKLAKNDPYVAEAIEKGQARGIRMVTDSLFQNAMKGNVAAQIFWLKNRGAWQDKQELDQRLQVETKMSFEDAVDALKAAGIDPGKV
jgi:hypothetical protein